MCARQSLQCCLINKVCARSEPQSADTSHFQLAATNGKVHCGNWLAGLLLEHVWSDDICPEPPPPVGYARVVYSVVHSLLVQITAMATDLDSLHDSVQEAQKFVDKSQALKYTDVKRCAYLAQRLATRKIALQLGELLMRFLSLL